MLILRMLQTSNSESRLSLAMAIFSCVTVGESLILFWSISNLTLRMDLIIILSSQASDSMKLWARLRTLCYQQDNTSL